MASNTRRSPEFGTPLEKSTLGSSPSSLLFESPTGSDDDFVDPLTTISCDDDMNSTEKSCNDKPNPRPFIATAIASVSIIGALIATEQRRQEQMSKEMPLLFTSGQPGNSTTSSFRVRRPMKPQFLVGTHGALSSAFAFFHPGPRIQPAFTESLTMPNDGATVALHWYCPHGVDNLKDIWKSRKTTTPIVLILHGINNHAGFGYIKSIAAACVRNGWIAAAMDFRGSRSHLFTTPRFYNAAFTNDVRSVINILSHRSHILFAVGNSLGANILVKYIGEEGERCKLRAAVSLSNPVSIDSRHADWFHSPVLAAGVKGNLLKHVTALRPIMQAHPVRDALWRLFVRSWNLAAVDEALANLFIRNDSDNGTRMGYTEGVEYWEESCSYRYMADVAIPLLQVAASDDTLIHESFQRTLRFNLSNPHITVATTPCGGHLGWHEQNSGMYAADVLMVDFFRAALEDTKVPRSKL